jgi:hypothetical protein
MPCSSGQCDSATRPGHRARRAVPRHDLHAQSAGPHGGVTVGKLPGQLQRPGPIERQPAQRRVGLLADRTVGHYLAGFAQAGVIREVFTLDTLKLSFWVIRGTRRSAQQHQLECFKVHSVIISTRAQRSAVASAMPGAGTRDMPSQRYPIRDRLD